jgi:LacI family transcriptional regulator
MPDMPQDAPTPGHRPVLADVARLAGVSTASVSRVLNEPDKVRPATRARVLAAIDQLGYVLDGAARALKSGRVRSIGAVVPTLDNAIFASAINALQRRLAQRDFTLLVASSDYEPAEELREARALLVRGVDGMVLVGASHAPELYRLLNQKQVPWVHTWTHLPEHDGASIGFDNRLAAQQTVNYLVGLGHRRIAMVAGVRAGNDRAVARVDGVIEALAGHGLALAPEQLLERPYDVRAGREAARELLAAPTPPSAIICGNDVLAMGVLFEAQAQGVPVPGRLSVVGFDDLPIAASLVPPLTTIRVPAVEMGRRAADYLLERIDGRNPPRHTGLEAELIVRGTTAPPAPVS